MVSKTKPNKRDAILDAMLDVVVEHGFHEAPMSLIAERSNTSAGLIYHHFASKEEIIQALYERIYALKTASILDGFAPDMDPQQAFVVAGGVMTLIDVAMILKKRLGPIARRVPTREIPDWLVRILAKFVPDLRLVAPELGNIRNLTNAKAKRILSWTPRSNEDCIVATAESLQRLGLLKA